MSASNFLELENICKSLDEPEFPDFSTDVIRPEFKSITPIPGFCVKAKTDDNEKLFINVCHSTDIPPPPDSFDINSILTSGGAGGGEEESLFKFPLSLGEFHNELDKSGNECKCYDVVLNSKYYEDVSKSPVLRDFIVTLACSGLERKYNINIDVGTWSVLNKKYHGQMPPHYIRLKAASGDTDLFGRISPVKDEEIIMPVKNPTRLVVTPDPEILNSRLFQSPASGQAELIVFQCLIRGVHGRKGVRVFVTKGQLILCNSKKKTILSVPLPLLVIPEQSLSNFWRNRLTVAMPVACLN